MKTANSILMALCLAVTLFPLTTAGIASTRWGIKIGASTNRLSFHPSSLDAGQESHREFGIGLFGRIDMCPVTSLQPELLYVRKGARWQVREFSGGEYFPSTATVSVDYLEYPVLFRFAPNVHIPLKPNLYVGPVPAVRLHQSGDAPFGSPDFCTSYAETSKWARLFDFGAVIGGGFDLQAGKGIVTVDARYNLGVANINNAFSDWKIRNRSLSFWLGYCF